MIALLAAQLRERRRSRLSWGLPLGVWAAFIVAIYPSIQSALTRLVHRYPQALKQGVEPVAFVGVTAVAVVFAALGAVLFEQRDLAG